MKISILLYLAFFICCPVYAQNDFHYGDFGMPSTLEPVTATAPVEHHLCQFLFDSLVVRRPQGDFIFSAAKEMDISPDGLSYTFLLRDNLKWADGVPLTSKDIEFTLGILLNKKTSNYDSTLEQYVDEVLCINPQTVIITLKRPFYHPLALFTFKILPKHKFRELYLTRSSDFCRFPLGSGPFVYKGNDQNVYHLKPNPHYRDTPSLKNIKIHVYHDKNEASQDMLKGKLHFLAEVDLRDIKEFKNKKEFVLHRYSRESIYFLAFNHRKQHRLHDLIRDASFRRALTVAIDRKKILQKIFSETKTPELLSGPFPVSAWAYDKNIKHYPFDIPRADYLLKRVLEENNYRKENGKWLDQAGKEMVLSLLCLDEYVSEQACREIAHYWQQLGIHVRIEKVDRQTYNRRVYDNYQFDLVYIEYKPGYGVDAFPLFDPGQTSGAKQNFSGYTDPQLSELFSQLQKTLNPWGLQTISHKIHRIIHDNAVHIFLWQLEVYAVRRKNVKNFKLHPRHLFNFSEKWNIVAE